MSDPLDFTQQPTILIVDDSPTNLALMTGVLSRHYKTRAASAAASGLQIAATPPLPDLVLLDIEMPDMDGYEVCRRLKAEPVTSGIPVIFLTAKSGVRDVQKGFDAGCVDYITKPISAPILHARVKTHLLLKGARDFLNDQKKYLEAAVTGRTREAALDKAADIRALGRKVEELSAAMHERADIDPALLHAVDEIGHEIKRILQQPVPSERP
jgi:putative two-component system response regulator